VLANGEVELPTLKPFNVHAFGKAFPWLSWWASALAQIGLLEDPEAAPKGD